MSNEIEQLKAQLEKARKEQKELQDLVNTLRELKEINYKITDRMEADLAADKKRHEEIVAGLTLANNERWETILKLQRENAALKAELKVWENERDE